MKAQGVGPMVLPARPAADRGYVNMRRGELIESQGETIERLKWTVFFLAVALLIAIAYGVIMTVNFRTAVSL